MLALLAPFLLRARIPERFHRAFVIAGAVVLLFALLGVAKCSYDRALIRQHDAEVTTKTLTKDAKAKEAASEQRATDTIAIDKAGKERSDAIHQAPAGKPSAASIRLNCERLRRAGTDASRFPECG